MLNRSIVQCRTCSSEVTWVETRLGWKLGDIDEVSGPIWTDLRDGTVWSRHGCQLVGRKQESRVSAGESDSCLDIDGYPEPEI